MMYDHCNRCKQHCAPGDAHCGRGNYVATEYRPGMGGEPMTLPARPEERDFGCFGPEMPFDAPHDFGGPFERGFYGPGEGHHRGPGRPPRGGMPPFGHPPRGGMPDADRLKAHIGEASLAELIMMASRLMPRRPGAGSARGQNLVLSILAGRGTMSQRELQQMLALQPASLSELVSKLEHKGFLSRERGEDRRGNLLSITEAGRAAIPQSLPDPEDALFEALAEDQREALTGLLRTLLMDWASKLPVRPAEPGHGFGGRFMTLEARPDDDGRGVKV